ncbi:hypothetical protein Hhel01_00256 [Haloferula helveola]
MEMELGSEIRSVVVEGSGYDPYLAALAFKRMLPDLKVGVRCREGSSNPIGEVASPFLLRQLIGSFGIREVDLHTFGRPTWCLGFRFLWGARGEFIQSFDTAPFRKIPKSEIEAGFLSATDDQRSFSIGEALIRLKKVLPPGVSGDGITGLQVRPEPFTDLLQRACAAVGVETTPEGEIADGGLLVRTDAAADRDDWIEPKDGTVAWRSVTGLRRRSNERMLPFCTVQAHPSGWSWRMDHDDSMGIGFAYDPECVSDDDAREWLLERLGKPAGELRVTDWHGGRTSNPWKADSVHIGDAAGFVQPLSGMRLSLLVHEVQTMCRFMIETGMRPGEQSRRLYKDVIGRARDEIRDFEALHFRYPDDPDSECWKKVSSTTGLGEHEELLGVFESIGPSAKLVNALPTIPGVVGINSWVATFLGLGVPFRGRGEVSEADRAVWRTSLGELEANARRGADSERALVAARSRKG